MSASKQAGRLGRLSGAILGYRGLSRKSRLHLRRELLGYPLLRIVSGLTAAGFAASLAHKSMGAERWQRDLLVAAPMIAMLGALVWSTGPPRRRKQLILYPALGAVLLTAAVGAVSNAVVLLLVVLGTHWLFSSVTVNRAHIWRQNYPPAERGRAAARVVTMSFLVAATAAAVASTCFHYAPWTYRIVYPVFAAVASLGLISLAKLRVRRQERDHARYDGALYRFRDIIRLPFEDPVYGKYTLSQSLQGFGNIMCTVIEVAMLNDVLRADWIQLGLVLVVLPIIGQLTSVFFWARFSGRVHALQMRAWTGCFWLACRLVFVAAVFARSMPLMFVMAAMKGMTISGSVLSWNLTVGYLAPRRHASRYMSLHVFMTGVRGLLAPLLAGFLFAGLGAWAAVVAVGIMACGVSGFCWLGHKYGRSGPRDGQVTAAPAEPTEPKTKAAG
jgi:hypothetical protein